MADQHYPAEFTAHCPNGATHCCANHASQIRGLFGFLGAHVALTAAPDGAECANCINAAKKSVPSSGSRTEAGAAGTMGETDGIGDGGKVIEFTQQNGGEPVKGVVLARGVPGDTK